VPKRFRSDRTVDNEISVKIIGIFDSFAVPNRTTISVPSSVRDNVLRQGVPAKRLRPFPSHSIPRDSHTFERNRNVVRANNQRFPVNVPMVRRRFGHVILLRTNERLRKNCYDRVNKNGGPGGGERQKSSPVIFQFRRPMFVRRTCVRVGVRVFVLRSQFSIRPIPRDHRPRSA